MNQQETFRDIDGFDGYQVSDLGRLRGYWDRKRTQRGCVRIRLDEPRILSPLTNPRGYKAICLRSNDGVPRMLQVHRLVLTAFVGPCPEGHVGCHIDGDRQNARLDNLYWGTRRENMEDCRRHGRFRDFKLTDEVQEKIVQLRQSGMSQTQIASELGLHQATVSKCLINRGMRTQRPRTKAS